MTIHCLPHFNSLSNSPCHYRKTSIFIISTSNLQGKGMGFLIFAKNFMFIALLSWIFELLLGSEKYSVRTWVWFILLNEFDWVLVILIVRCLSHCFSSWCLCSKLCFITMLLCAYHVHGRVSQWQLFVTVWCSIITLYWLIGVAYD